MSIDEITGLKQLIGDLQLRNQATLADNAGLVRIARAAIDCLRGLLYQDGTDTAIKRADRSMYGFESLLAAEHPGAALLTELEAARAVVDAVKTRDRGNIDDALFVYDKAAQR